MPVIPEAALAQLGPWILLHLAKFRCFFFHFLVLLSLTMQLSLRLLERSLCVLYTTICGLSRLEAFEACIVRIRTSIQNGRGFASGDTWQLALSAAREARGGAHAHAQ